MFWIFIIIFFSLIGLVILHEFGHFYIAKKFGVEVEEFGIGYPPRLFAKKIGDVVYSLNLFPFGAFVKVKGEIGGIEDDLSFSNKPIWQRFLIILGGVLSFWLISFCLFSFVSILGEPVAIGDNDFVKNAKVVVVKVVNNSIAEKYGIKNGDIILQVKSTKGDIKIEKTSDLQNFIKNNQGEKIELKIKRNNQILTKILDLPNQKEKAVLGVMITRIAFVKKPFYLAPFEGAKNTVKFTGFVVRSIFNILKEIIFSHKIPKNVALVGPIGVSIIFYDSLNLGFSYFLWIFALISIHFAVFNLLPIPALDGGKLLFLLIESIRKKPINNKLEQNITLFFFFILLILMIFVTANDILKIIH
ncbi:MAG: M50 family metallopeptidase [Minisyncoccia bacterium]